MCASDERLFADAAGPTAGTYDRAAIAALYDRYRARLGRALSPLPPDQRVDVVQRLFVRLIDRVTGLTRGEVEARWSRRGCVAAYIHVVTKNLVREQLRRAQRGEPSPAAPPVEPPGPEETLERQQRLSVAWREVERLDEARRSVFDLHYKEDLSLKETAARLGLNESTVRTWHQRDLARIARKLRRQA